MYEHSRKPLEAGHIIGGYGIVRVIGQGGFGIVYEAENPTTLERVAIKQFYPNAIATWQHGTIVVKGEDDRELVAKILKRFQQEAAMQFNFRHDNILKVKNFIAADNTGYMISEYIDGGSLLNFLKPYGSTFPDEGMFRRTMEPVLDALSYVHERLTLHRDVSPDNIMVDVAGRPVLVDFGAAKLDLRLNHNPTSVVQFREDYAPIEQQYPSIERPEGYYTDIFAAAGTMYRVLTGKPPERAVGRSLAAKDPYVPVADVSKVRCSPEVYKAIDCGLAMAGAERPATIAIFRQMLGWHEGGPVTAALPPLPGSWQPIGSPSAPALATEAPAAPSPASEDVTDSPAPDLQPAANAEEQRALAEPETSPPVQPNFLLNVPPQDGALLEEQPPSVDLPLEDQSPIPPNPRWGSYVLVMLLLAAAALFLFLSHPPVTTTALPPPAPAPIKFSYVSFENYDIDRGDFPDAPQLRLVDKDACETACDERTGCIGYSYNKWERACYLKQSISAKRFEPSSTAGVRMDQPIPSNLDRPLNIEKARLALTGTQRGTPYRTTSQACFDRCDRDDACLGYQFSQGTCTRFSQISGALSDSSMFAGVKRQAAQR
jgi:serine/threonine protein kinase